MKLELVKNPGEIDGINELPSLIIRQFTFSTVSK